jgi:serine/threonine-protein kinase
VHQAGLVHRDLKPENLFLTRRADGSPQVKVLDFGVSKSLLGDAALSPRLTQTQALIGSPSYMSPEQIRNAKTVDARTDIWTLGVILYELIVGDTPFAAETPLSLLAEIVAEQPTPMRSRCHDVPAELDAVVMRCLEKDPDRRYESTAQLARALAPFASHPAKLSARTVMAPPPRPVRTPKGRADWRPLRWGLAAALVGVAVALALPQLPFVGPDELEAGAAVPEPERVAVASAAFIAAPASATAGGSGTSEPSASAPSASALPPRRTYPKQRGGNERTVPSPAALPAIDPLEGRR